MAIKQFNATYIPQDDRIFFRFNTDEDTEFRFWLTRRVTLFILAATQHLMVKQLEQGHSPEAAKAIAQFAKEAVQSTIKKENTPAPQGAAEVYQSASQFPIGAEALLVTEAKCSIHQVEQQDELSLDLMLPGGGNLNIKMAGPTLQAMGLLLDQIREFAGWGGIPAVIENHAPESAPQSVSKTLLH
ncbi:hypothetical protein [Polynucleobacter antarcticus]|uniref:Uncharacterized protein n=1 Tax=Polynucleobacter antarcticus TaxID=1743162 RepID=A0A6M9PT35_9BURK|nr:hypothetical protein [Polynucleobacter antarcticus]QKM61935.1 hypothetical protein DCO16_01860 [Polynucleobacter antarcticus]